MKTKIKYLAVLGLIAFILLVVPQGCATKNPAYNPSLPATSLSGNNPEYLPGTNTPVKVIGTIQAVNNEVPTPWQTLINNGLAVILGVTTVVAGAIASSKNKQAVAANANAAAANAQAATSTAAAKVLANNIPSTAVQATIESSPTPEIAGIVAQHLQNAS